MICTAKTSLVALALAASALTFGAGSAEAVTDYANCDALHKDFEYGVAKSKRAAKRAYRDGMHRPAVRPAVYKVNNESDADKDGTACEVPR